MGVYALNILGLQSLGLFGEITNDIKKPIFLLIRINTLQEMEPCEIP